MAADLFKIEISASAVAWYGAIMATVGMLVSLYSVFRDRANIKILYQRDMKIIGRQTIYDQDITYFNVTVANQGRRPVNITKAALRTIGTQKKYALLADSFSAHRNRVLDESKPTTDFMTKQDEALLANTWFICVYDGTGKVYRKYLHLFLPLSILWRRFRQRVSNQENLNGND